MTIKASVKGISLWNRAKKIIPGGAQLLSKRSEMFLPDHWPSYYSKSQGCYVWDLDGNKFTDVSIMGIGSCILGYADPDVNHAVRTAVDNGSMSTLNPPEEVKLAEHLLELHPWADMVRFSRGGGEAVSVAVRIARAATGLDKIAFCGYHGWCDWYIAANLGEDKNLDGHLMPGLAPRGVPRGLQGTALPFRYNHAEELEGIFAAHPGEIAAIVMEPIREMTPEPGFLEKVRAMATKHNALLIFDEVTIGWKLACGGSHLNFKVNPDIAVFGKSLGNGFAMSAIVGTKAAMDACQESFISSTYWTERIGPAAALATVQKMRRIDVPAHLAQVGRAVRKIWSDASATHSIPITVKGTLPISVFAFDLGEKALAAKTFLTQEMLNKGFLATTLVYACLSHSEEILKEYEVALQEVFGLMRQALESDKLEASLQGPLAQTGFVRLN